MKSTVALVRRVLPLRERARPLYKDKPCLNYDMGICPGACQGLVSEEAYAETVRLAEMVFRGEGGELLSRLEERMEAESHAERFERAGEIKAQMALVRGGLLGSALHFSSGGVAAGGGGGGGGLLSGATSSAEGNSGGFRRDVVAVGLAGSLVCFQVFQVRGGRLTGRLGFNYRVEHKGMSRGEVLQACLERYWGDALKSAQVSTVESGRGRGKVGLPPSRPLEGGGAGEKEGGGGGGVAVLDVPEEIVTADALPEGGAALLAELLSGAKKAAVAAQQQKEEAISQGGEGGSGTRGTKGKNRGGLSRRRTKIAGKSKPPAVDVKVVHGKSGTGERYHLCVMVLKNAELEAKGLLKGGEATVHGLSQLARMLGLESAPARIEGYDVSHTGGGQAVASVVCFVDGKVSPKNHRRYKIRSPEVRKGHSDDYASLREVIARRFSPPSPPLPPPTLAATRGINVTPELVVIDGGQGQLAAALEGAAIAAGEWESLERDTAATLLSNGFDNELTTPAAAEVTLAVNGTSPVAEDDVTVRGATTIDDQTSNKATGSSSPVASALHPFEGGDTDQGDPDAVLLTAAAVPLAEPSIGRAGGDGARRWNVNIGRGRRVTFVSLAKKEEEVFVPGENKPLAAALEAGPTSPGVMILRQVGC